VAGTGEVRTIPAEELRRIRGVALEWVAYNGCPHPRSMRVVLTTRDAATRVLQGPAVRSRPDDEIYLVVVDGDIVLQEAVDRGAPRAPTGSWAALIIKPWQLRVGSLTLRPAEAAVDIGSLGRVYTLAG
jgi:hypothetical protein